MSFDLSQIDHSWTLFLDRDGVINYEIQGTYVRNWQEFIFYPQAPENIAYFNKRFQHIILATNQRGINKGIMSLEDLQDIHSKMIKQIEAANGKIERIYFCLDIDDFSPCRKPNPGMALQAAVDYPESPASRIKDSFSPRTRRARLTAYLLLRSRVKAHS